MFVQVKEQNSTKLPQTKQTIQYFTYSVFSVCILLQVPTSVLLDFVGTNLSTEEPHLHIYYCATGQWKKLFLLSGEVEKGPL